MSSGTSSQRSEVSGQRSAVRGQRSERSAIVMKNHVHAFVLLLMCLVLGCSRNHPMAPVSGTVTLKNKPLSSGRVIFIHELGHSNFGDIQADGSYRLMAPVGENRVAIECLEDPSKAQ